MKRLFALTAMIALCAAAGVEAKPAGKSAPPLSAYVGKYPFDTVKGVTFLDHPTVRAAIEAAVKVPEIRAAILEKNVVTTPIRETEGRLLARAFDPRSGGDVNWAVLMVTDGSKAAVCYSTGVEQDVRGADWYLDGEKVFTLYAMCPGRPEDVEEMLGNWPIGAIPS